MIRLTLRCVAVFAVVFLFTQWSFAVDRAGIDRQLTEVSRKADVVIHVATCGNDAWSGHLAKPNAAGTDGPLRTLKKAQDQLRQLRQKENDSAKTYAVEVHAGIYELTSTMVFTKADSGLPGKPVIWKAAEGEVVRLSGGRFLNGFTAVSDTTVRVT